MKNDVKFSKTFTNSTIFLN